MDLESLQSVILEHRDELAKVAEFLRVFAGICWTMNYFSMMYVSGRDKIPNTGVFAVCCDTAWEFVYAFVHPRAADHFKGYVAVWFLVHLAVIAYILKFAPNEWHNVPVVKNNLVFIYGVTLLGFLGGQLALAAEIGPDLGFFYGGVLCQTLASLGPICQLLNRNSIRGSSLLTWGLRAMATGAGFIKLSIYYFADIPAGPWPWFESPMCMFYIILTLVLDISYPFVYCAVWRRESERGVSAKKSN